MRKVYVEARLITIGTKNADKISVGGYSEPVWVPKELLFESIPPSEPAQEWSPDKAYTIYEANYLAAKYGLEKGYIGDKPYWTRVEDCKEKHCRLRKPQSAEDLVKKVLNDFKSGKIPTDDIAYNILINDANLEIRFNE